MPSLGALDGRLISTLSVDGWPRACGSAAVPSRERRASRVVSASCHQEVSSSRLFEADLRPREIAVNTRILGRRLFTHHVRTPGSPKRAIPNSGLASSLGSYRSDFSACHVGRQLNLWITAGDCAGRPPNYSPPGTIGARARHPARARAWRGLLRPNDTQLTESPKDGTDGRL